MFYHIVFLLIMSLIIEMRVIMVKEVLELQLKT
jgi:hypothetical protein